VLETEGVGGAKFLGLHARSLTNIDKKTPRGTQGVFLYFMYVFF